MKIVKVKNLFFKIAITALIVSCQDSKEFTANSFAIGAEVSAVTSGILIGDTKANLNALSGVSYYRHEVLLFADSLRLDMSSLKLSGKGHRIVLIVNSNSGDLETGSYEFTGNEDSPNSFQLSLAFANLEYDEDTDEFNKSYVFGESSLSIQRNGVTYTILLEGKVYPPLEGDMLQPDVSLPSRDVKISYKGQLILKRA